jgi:hypothetical protein
MLDYQPSGNPDDVNCTAHQQLCREAGRKSLVLLKNQNQILPLSKLIGSVALIGPSAAVAQIDGSGSAYVTPYYSISPKQGIENAIGAARVHYLQGCAINNSDTSGFAAARNYAQSADVVIYCGGLDPDQEGEGHDRTGSSTSLPGKQQDMINTLAAVNPNLVVVIFSGGVCSLDRCISAIKGLLYAYYPGQEVGNALADVLFGEVNPGGKMPVTMPKNDAQLPTWNDNLNDDYGCGYRWFDKMGYQPQFAFGYGLSYTSFSYSNLRISPASVAPGEPVTVQVDITNTGSRSGDEVVQLYLSKPETTVPMPVKELKGFKRVTIDTGHTVTVEIVLTADELYYYNETSNTYEVGTGEYTVRVGGSSDDLPFSANFVVRDDLRKPDLLITHIKMVPPFPLPGQKVAFYATVKNQGSAPVPEGKAFKMIFNVNGERASWSDEHSAYIPAGGMVLIAGVQGPHGVCTWTAGTAGVNEVEAIVDPENAVDECVESNNSLTAQLTVYPEPPENLALHKAVTVSSVEAAGLDGVYAVDGNLSTRWSSSFSDPQFIIIDLGTKEYMGQAVLYWETAYAKEYYLEVSDDTTMWTSVAHITNGDGGIDRIPVNAETRFVRMRGIQRATVWGYSLFEIELYSKPPDGISTYERPATFSLRNNYPNPFNPDTKIEFTLAEKGYATLRVYNIVGQEVTVLFDQVGEAGRLFRTIFSASGLPSGIYIAVLNSGRHRQCQPMVLLK